MHMKSRTYIRKYIKAGTKPQPHIIQVISSHMYMCIESNLLSKRTWVEECKGAGVPRVGEEATYEANHQQPSTSGGTKMETDTLPSCTH